MRFTLLAFGLVALLGCDEGAAPPVEDSGTATDTGSEDSAVASDTSTPLPDGSPADCFSLTYSSEDPTDTEMIIGEMVDDVFTTYAESGRAVFEWGFQGGTMITPRIALPPELAGDGDCVQVTLENLEDPDHPLEPGDLVDWFPVEGLDMFRVREGGITEPIFDQMAWIDPTGWRIRVKATVRGVDFALTETVAIEIAPPADIPPQCLALPTSGRGCTYRRIPGAAVITSNEAASSGGACPDPRFVMGVFEPTDPTHVDCYPDFVTDLAMAQPLTLSFNEPPASCLESYPLDSRIPVILEVIVAGGCPPYQLQIDEPACDAACM